MDNQGKTSAVAARVVGECNVSLWGLTPLERLRRQLAAAGVTDVAPAAAGANGSGSTVLLRADWLYEQRTIEDLLARPGLIVRRGATPVAAHVPAVLAAATLAHLEGSGAAAPEGVAETTVEALSPAYNDTLRKAEPPRLFPVRADNRAALERYLFDGAYKGVTDIVTKWAWPAPARSVVRVCTELGITPNLVTLSSLVLVIVATWLFGAGHFWPGLCLGWIMTFFDTVDGKLARVSVHATTFGHALDKGIDLIHPPIWYIAWGYGLHLWGGSPGVLYWDVYVVILAGYILGRLAEGAFELFGGFALYTWQPVDAWVRLVIARRNPNLVLLTTALLAGEPEAGLYAVAGWTALSTVYLVVRLAQAAFRRITRGPLESWLKAVTDHDERLSARVFARRDLPAQLQN
jgi:phosphatidylglycerophosphate synthase